VPDPPFAHGLQERRKSPPINGNRVLDLGWNLRVNLSLNQALPLQLAKLRGERFLSGSRNQPAKFIEAANAPAHVPEDDAFPLAADGVERPFHGTALNSIFHETISPQSAYLQFNEAVS